MTWKAWGRFNTAVHQDARGALCPIEGPQLHFPVRRIYTISRWPKGVARGNHTHREVDQVFLVVTGRVEFDVIAPDGHRSILSLCGPNEGIYVPAMTWHTMTALEEGSSLLGLASGPYIEEEYIRSREEWDQLRAGGSG